jgi:hypothetical protein
MYVSMFIACIGYGSSGLRQWILRHSAIVGIGGTPSPLNCLL